MPLNLTGAMTATGGDIWWWILGIAAVVGMLWWWSAASTHKGHAQLGKGPAGGGDDHHDGDGNDHGGDQPQS